MLQNTRMPRNFADQLPRNLFSNIVYFLANIAIGIFLIPYFVSNLGIAAYGLIQLTTSITGYAAIFIQSLNISVSRFLTVDLQRKDYVAANRTFNTAFFGITAVMLLMVPVVLVAAWFIPSFFHVPAELESSTTLLFLGVCGAFFIRSWSGNFTVQLFAYNCLDLQNLVNLANLLVQTGLIILFFTLFGPDLVLVAVAYLAGAMLASGMSIVLSRRVCPHLRVSIYAFDHAMVNDLCGLGGWVIINNIGSLLFLQIDLIVVNLIFGATSAGEYAIALQWAILLRAFAAVFSGILTPTLFSYYARGETNSLIQITKSAVKMMGLVMALPIGLVCGFAPQLLTVWVGPEFTNLAPLMAILTVHLSINLAVLPLFSINVVYNKVRVPGILTLVMGIWNVALAIALPLLTGWGYLGVALAGAIVLTLKNAFITPWYATKVLGVEFHTFIRSMLSGVLATIIISISTATIGAILPLTSLAILGVVGISVTMIYLVAVWSFSLSKFERKLFEPYILLVLRRIIA